MKFWQEASVLGNLGIAYRDLGQKEKALEYQQMALRMQRARKYRLEVSSSFVF